MSSNKLLQAALAALLLSGPALADTQSISGLPFAQTPMTGFELIPIDQLSGAVYKTRKTTILGIVNDFVASTYAPINNPAFTGTVTLNGAPLSGGGGGGITLTLPSIFTVTGSPGANIAATLASQSPGYVFASPIGSAGTPAFRPLDGTDLTFALPTGFDFAFGATRGSILYRGAAGWTALTPGASGYVLKAQGAGADPAWGSLSLGSSSLAGLTDVAVSSPANLDFLRYQTSSSKWINTKTADLPAGSITASSSTLALDRAATGESISVTLSANVTAVTIAGWSPTGTLSRLVLKVTSTGSFTIAGWPAGTKWPNGTAPTITPSGTDMIVLTTFDGGTTVYGSLAGQNYF